MFLYLNTGGRSDDNAVLHEKTHGVLFAFLLSCFLLSFLVLVLFFFWVWNPQASAPITSGTRVLGLPIGDCAGSSNNLVPRGTKLSATDVTAKAFFERLYLVLGLSPFEPRVNCPYAPTPPPLA